MASAPHYAIAGSSEGSSSQVVPNTAQAVASQLSWMAAAEEEVALDDFEALVRETSGIMEKLAEGNLKLGSWQMVLWQPRFVFAEVSGLCYQKITADERPIGKIKKIDFGDIREIEELEYGEFVLQCNKRDYTFKVPDEQKCQIFVHNLRQLRERHRVMQEGAQQAAEPGRKSGSWLRR